MKPDESAKGRDAAPDAKEYEEMLLLERLESLREEMEELGIQSLADLERKIEALQLRLSARGFEPHSKQSVEEG
jgi:hypothetical protein